MYGGTKGDAGHSASGSGAEGALRAQCRAADFSLKRAYTNLLPQPAQCSGNNGIQTTTAVKRASCRQYRMYVGGVEGLSLRGERGGDKPQFSNPPSK